MAEDKILIVIYWLLDMRPETVEAGFSEGRPFYCGKTVQSEKQRLGQHKIHAQRHPEREHSKRIFECGEHLAIKVMETVQPDENWASREKHWIAYLRSRFSGVTNVSDGGETGGFRSSEKTKLFHTRISPNDIRRIKLLNSNVSEFIRKAILEKLEGK